MAPDNIFPVRNRKYVAKDFDALKADLLEYARSYYPDRMQDFSESSLGGLFLDMAAYIGDNLSFYLDHQFSEMDPLTVFEDINAQRLLRMAGVKITGAAPATANVTFAIQVPGQLIGDAFFPNESALPVIKSGTRVSSQSGITFILQEDLDFSEKKIVAGVEKFVAKVYRFDNEVGPGVSFIMNLTGECVSGNTASETIQIGSTFIPFLEYPLQQSNISNIISVTDSYGNQYYEVDSLAEDVVYKNLNNTGKDRDEVKSSLQLVPAPYRFIRRTDLTTRATSLVFGDGTASSVQDNVIATPSNFALPFKNKKTFPRTQLNPQKLLNNGTLGTIALNSTITVTYSYGGGANHNVKAGQITNLDTLLIYFPKNPSNTLANSVVIECVNEADAFGGSDAPTTSQLLAQVPAMKNSQNRIVTQQDLLSRIYTIPSNFGSVFRASIHDNKNNPLSTLLYIVGIDENGFLKNCPDTLKKNISNYIDSFRMISDSIDILDSQIINLSIEYEILVTRNSRENLSVILTNVNKTLKNYFSISNSNIDQGINIDEIKNIIYTIPNVTTIPSLKLINRVGVFEGRNYNNNYFDVDSNTKNGLIIPPLGAIFEIRYPGFDIKGKAS